MKPVALRQSLYCTNAARIALEHCAVRHGCTKVSERAQNERSLDAQNPEADSHIEICLQIQVDSLGDSCFRSCQPMETGPGYASQPFRSLCADLHGLTCDNVKFA